MSDTDRQPWGEFFAESQVFTDEEGTDLFVIPREVADALVGRLQTLEAALENVVHEFNMWSEDANDGTYAYYRSDGLMTACVAARAALCKEGTPQ